MAGNPGRAGFPFNLRDLAGDVIDPNDHFVLPSGHRLSRNDIQMLSQMQRFVAAPFDPYTNVPFANRDNVLAAMADYMNSPIGTVAGKRPGANQGRDARRRRPNPAPRQPFVFRAQGPAQPVAPANIPAARPQPASRRGRG